MEHLTAEQLIDIIRKNNNHPDRGYRGYRRDTVLCAARETLARRFGDLHGWNLSPKAFSLETLARQGVSGTPSRTGHHQWFDHQYYYREPARPYRAAAIVCHNYDYQDDPIEYRRGCRFEVVSDFPSWWYPGRSQIVLVTPKR